MNPEPFPFRIPFKVVVTEKVPEEVTGDPLTLNPVGMVKPMLVTLPVFTSMILPLASTVNAFPFAVDTDEVLNSWVKRKPLVPDVMLSISSLTLGEMVLTPILPPFAIKK